MNILSLLKEIRQEAENENFNTVLLALQQINEADINFELENQLKQIQELVTQCQLNPIDTSKSHELIQRVENLYQNRIEKLKARRKLAAEEVEVYLDLIAIGYWENDLVKEYPHPTNFSVGYKSKRHKEKIISHLKSGQTVKMYRGGSWCRYSCKNQEDIGSVCLSDGVYIYPEGLVHYVEKHDLKLPDVFIKHVTNFSPKQNQERIIINSIDDLWWKSFKREE